MQRHGPSITALLIGIATVPAFVMFLVVSGFIYAARIGEVRADIDERGRLLAAVLADSSRYGVVSGNEPSLQTTLRNLMSADPSIAALEILDVQRRPVVVLGATPRSGGLAFEHPIKGQAIDIDLFDSTGTPHGIADGRPKVREGPLIGYSRVRMSPEPLMRAKRTGLLIAGLIVLVAALLSAILGVWLTQRVRRPLSNVMSALRSIRQGDYAVQLERDGKGELGELQDAIVDMGRELAAARHELEAKVAQRTAQLEDAVKAVRAADEEKRRLIAHGNALMEEERRRIAAEIHDQLNASLLAVRLTAASLRSRDGESPPAEDVDEAAGRIEKTVEAVYESARRIVKMLRPEVLDTLGLRKALDEMVRQYDEMHPTCRFQFLCAQDFPQLPDALAITVYRIVQEALSNVVKHARASVAVVSLATDENGRRLVVAVSDNGRGMSANSGGGGMGLIGMRERAMAAGGTLEITTDEAGGTVVEVRLPSSPDDGARDGPTPA
jgi:two-component system, NarL family, sensor histidine kinase UhpB